LLLQAAVVAVLLYLLEEMEALDLVVVAKTLVELYQVDLVMKDHILLLKVMMVEILHLVLPKRHLVEEALQTLVLIDQVEMLLLEEMELQIQ
jgi:hypothetical protein